MPVRNRSGRRNPLKKKVIIEYGIAVRPAKTPVLRRSIKVAERKGLKIAYLGIDPINSFPSEKFVSEKGVVAQGYARGKLGQPLNLKPNSVDEIHLHMIDTHVEDLDETCRQLARILKPEGKIFITGNKERQGTKHYPFGLSLPQALEILSKHFRITQFFSNPQENSERTLIQTPNGVRVFDTGKGIIEGIPSPLKEWELVSVSARQKFLTRFTNYKDLTQYFIVLEPKSLEPRTVKDGILNPALFKPGTKQMKRESIGIDWPLHGDRQPRYGGDGKGEYSQFRIRRTAISKEEKRKIMENAKKAKQEKPEK